MVFTARRGGASAAGYTDSVDAVVDTIIRAVLAIDANPCDKKAKRWLRGKLDD